MDRYEVVIGLEVHTHLKTDSKLFSPAPVRYGDLPNHDVHPIDLAMPGVLPVLNQKVVGLAIRLGLATHSSIQERSVFSRKNYFYPDLPKGYQISQYDEPVVSDGFLDIEVPTKVNARSKKEKAETCVKRVGITRAHLEEDAGKSIHDTAVAGSDATLIDLNRAGVPLLEIVSEPDLRSASEAVAYLRSLRSILRYIDVSDADMEKGQFRCDANISLRLHGESEFGTRTEIKNLNSFASIEGAIHAEVIRQSEILDDGGQIVQATMLYDVDRNRTRVMRLKENADDYRYFDDPDLIPLQIEEAFIEAIRSELPELPEQKRVRFAEEYNLGSAEAEILVSSRSMADFFEETAQACDSAKAAANWISRDLRRELNERDLEVSDLELEPVVLAKLIRLVEDGRLTAKNARDLLPELVDRGGDPEQIMQERNLEAVSDSGLIDTLVQTVMQENGEAVELVRSGDDKPLNFLMGKVMQASQGKASPGEVRKTLVEKIKGNGTSGEVS
ncbi:MAG: Asp-tRNA(Asn)/Glu-tRNA(Gln) amidotransferase GatCAB subunit B [Deltaproteobacteria bacterium]|nr:Asp-tRNA(Asn)/Glu-tRNA(Gln) amidotransferase GatCAB subunit B [Deltaproteobacteria bacterium]